MRLGSLGWWVGAGGVVAGARLGPRAQPGMPAESLFQPLVLGGIAGSTAEIIVMPMIVV